MKKYSQFKELYESLKGKESWSQIIELGGELLKVAELTGGDRADIHEIMATTQHYLGNYDETIGHAKQAEEYADNVNVKARACYLVSAGYRSKFDLEGKNLSDKHGAKEWIEESLSLTSNPLLEDRWKAKVYFNAGALHHDLFENHLEAQAYYRQAISYYAPGTDDCNRIHIRMIRSILELGNATEALQVLEELRELIPLDSKTYVHFLQIEAKIAIKQQSYIKADGLLGQAIMVAERKGMRGDLQRLGDLREVIAADVGRDSMRSAKPPMVAGVLIDVDGTILSGSQERVVVRLHHLFDLIKGSLEVPFMDKDFNPCRNINDEMLDHLDGSFLGRDKLLSDSMDSILNRLKEVFGNEINIEEQKDDPVKQLSYYLDRVYSALCKRESGLLKENNLPYDLPNKTIIDGVIDVIQSYKDSGVAVMLVSNNHIKGTVRTLKDLGLCGFDGAIIDEAMITCSDDPLVGRENEKPHPHHLEVALDKAGFDCSEGINIHLIGDSIKTDMNAALNFAEKYRNVSIHAVYNTQNHKALDNEEISSFVDRADRLSLTNFSFKHITNYMELGISKVDSFVAEQNVSNRPVGQSSAI